MTRLLAGIALAAIAGCNAIIGIDGDYVVGDRDGGVGPSASATGGGASAATSSVSGSGGGTGAEGGMGGQGGTPDCPTSGGAMVALDGESYCIDATEVTNTAYAAWLGTNPDVATQIPACAWNTSFDPSAGWPPASDANQLPVTSVDWCDAFAFCAGQTKRLCGRLGGGSLPIADWNDPSKSQWFRACTADGANAYPYGDAFDSGTCNGFGFPASGVIDVKSAADCHGPVAPYTSLYDMSGNVDEWEDACSDSTGASDTCRRRGGSLYSKTTALRCDANASSARSSVGATTGFRCCAP